MIDSLEEFVGSLGESVFFNMACHWLGYDTFTTEVEFAYHTSLSGEETEVVLLLTEDNKPSQKVKFKVEISTE